MTAYETLTNSEISDQTLISRVRTGDQRAYGELWRRHSRAGLSAARSFARLAEPDDLVAEAFTQIYRTLQAQKGPTGAFRPYLYTTIRNLATRNVRHLAVIDDGVDLDLIAADDEDIDTTVDKSIMFTAFKSLPERWQTVLWYTEVEQLSPTQTAELVGLTPNATSALAYRARTALRAAWLQSHISESNLDPECRATRKKLGAYAQGTLSSRDQRAVDEHLKTCSSCPKVLDEVRNVAGRLALIFLPLILGGSATAAFLHSLSTAPQAMSVTAAPAPTGGFGGPRKRVSRFSRRATVISALAAGVVVLAGVGVVYAAIDSRPARPHISAVKTLPNPGPHPSRAPAKVDPIPTEPPAATGAPIIHVQPIRNVNMPTGSQPPVVTRLSAPALSSVTPLLTNQTHTVLAGTGKPGAAISITDNGVRVGITKIDSAGAWWWTATSLVEGANKLTFTQAKSGYMASGGANLLLTLDTIAPTPPTVDSTWGSATTTAPAFTGTGEPGDTVKLEDLAGQLLASSVVDATRHWATTPVAVLDPASSGISASQTDPAGNLSESTSVGTFAFTPAVIGIIDGATVAPAVIPITVNGWAGAHVSISFNGTTYGPFALDADGHVSVSLTGGNISIPLPDGTFTVTVAYVSNAGVTSTNTAAIVFTVAGP
jgi:RNA polymerase sigma factor (sigma-70 family)